MGLFDYPDDTAATPPEAPSPAGPPARSAPPRPAAPGATAAPPPRPSAPVRATSPQAAAAAIPASLPPAGPCRALDANIDVCGSLWYWADAYGRVHCKHCQPWAVPGQVRALLTVRPLPDGEFAWEHELQQLQQADTEWREVELPDGRVAYARGRGLPVEQLTDEWWRAAGERQDELLRLAAFDRQRMAGKISMTENAAEKNAAKNSGSKNSAAKNSVAKTSPAEKRGSKNSLEKTSGELAFGK